MYVFINRLFKTKLKRTGRMNDDTTKHIYDRLRHATYNRSLFIGFRIF